MICLLVDVKGDTRPVRLNAFTHRVNDQDSTRPQWTVNLGATSRNKQVPPPSSWPWWSVQMKFSLPVLFTVQILASKKSKTSTCQMCSNIKQKFHNERRRKICLKLWRFSDFRWQLLQSKWKHKIVGSFIDDVTNLHFYQRNVPCHFWRVFRSICQRKELSDPSRRPPSSLS